MNKKIILTILLAMLLAPFGMEAKKKVKEPEVPQLMNYPSAEVSEYRLHGGNVVIKGQIAGREGDEMLPQGILDQLNGRFTVIMRDYIVGKEKTSVIEFKPDGTFSMNVYVPYPMFVLVHPLGTMYACPGDTLEMIINPIAKTREEGIAWDGTGLSGEVTKLYEKIRKTYCDFPQDKTYEQGPDSLMKWRDGQVARLDDLVQKMNAGLPELEGCSPLASDILRTYIISQHLEHLCRYYMLTDMENIDRAAYWQNFFSFVTPRESYLIDNPLLMISADEFFFNYVECTVMRPINAGGVLDYIPFDYEPEKAEFIAKQKPIFRREYRRNAMNELHDKLHISPTDFAAQVCQLRSVYSTPHHPLRVGLPAREIPVQRYPLRHPLRQAWQATQGCYRRAVAGRVTGGALEVRSQRVELQTPPHIIEIPAKVLDGAFSARKTAARDLGGTSAHHFLP